MRSAGVMMATNIHRTRVRLSFVGMESLLAFLLFPN